jgi:N4-gp56 family major capsid protein
LPDIYLNTSSANYSDTTVAQILKAVQAALRGGLAYTPKGSIIPAALVKGSNATFRSVAYSDLPENGQVRIEHGDSDPDVESLDISFVEFVGAQYGRTVGLEDTARDRSPHNLQTAIVNAVARDIAVSVDNVPKTLYANAGADLFAGTGNDALGEVGSGDTLTGSLIKDAVAILRSSDVKPLANGLYACVASPLALRGLFADDKFVDEMKDADPSSFLTGQVAKYAGCAIIDAGSRGIVSDGAGEGSVDVFFATVIGADAVFAALGGLQIIPVTGADHSDALARRDLYSWKGLLGGILNDLQAQRFVNIACGSSL